MEHYIDWDDLEGELDGIEDPNKATWWNEKLWYTVGMTMAFFSINFFVTCLFHVPGNGWIFDFDLFISLILRSVAPIFLLGIKVQANLKKYVKKKAIEATIAEKIGEKDKVIEGLRRELDDKCSTLEALRQAEARL